MAKEKKVGIFGGVIVSICLIIMAVAIVMNNNEVKAQQQQPFKYYKALTQATDPSGLGYAGTLVYNTTSKHLWVLTGINNATGTTWVDLGSASSLGTVTVAAGGTGLTSITLHDLIIGNGTSAATLLDPSSTSGQPLVSQGTTSNPAFGAINLAGGSSIVSGALPAANNGLPLYSAGSQLTGANVKLTVGSCVLGSTCTVAVTYTSNSSYHCLTQDATTATGNTSMMVAYTSGNTVTISGLGTDTLDYICAGN